jgi:hypothetical protein
LWSKSWNTLRPQANTAKHWDGWHLSSPRCVHSLSRPTLLINNVWKLSVRCSHVPGHVAMRCHSPNSEATVSWVQVLGPAGWQSGDREVAACGWCKCFFSSKRAHFAKLATRAGFQMRVHQSKGPPEGFFALLSSVQHAPISPGDQSQPLMVFCCVVGHQPRIVLGIIFLHFIVFYLLLSHFLLCSFVPQAAAAVVAVDSMCYWYAHQLSSSTITAYFLSSI